MVPADFDKQDSHTDSLTRDDVDLIIQFVKANKVDGRGCLLGRTGKFLPDSHISECLSQKNKCKHFARFLELKAIESVKTNKRKCDWHWEDDDNDRKR